MRDPSLSVPESSTLNTVYRRSGLTAADLSSATGLSVGTVRLALHGFRYRNGQPKAAPPTDQTLARLASVLGIPPQTLRAVGRGRAADLIDHAEATVPNTDLSAEAAIAGRTGLARQVLSVFSTDELHNEIRRRERDAPARPATKIHQATDTHSAS